MPSLLPQRKSLNLSVPNYLGYGCYFVTICCFQKRCVFTTAARCDWLIKNLSTEAAVARFAIHAFCLMPDHLHFLSQGLSATSNLLHFVKAFKIKTSRPYVRRFGQTLWQRRFFDHVLRPSESVESFAWYIWLNPVRRGLASTPQQYRFSGSFSGIQMPVEWDRLTFAPTWK